jgi:CBS domain containing-hemolysin-like protein
MESYFGLRVVIVIFLIALNAFFAGSEICLLSVRNSRLRQMAEEGRAGARVALNLLANPERLLSVTQVGVTLASLGLGWAGEGTVYYALDAAFHPAAFNPLVSRLLHAPSEELRGLAASETGAAELEALARRLFRLDRDEGDVGP